MLESINWPLVGVIGLGALSFLSVLITWLKKKYPQLDPYFAAGAVILDEVDDILDAVILEFPENKILETVDDVVDKVIEELEQAGYKLDKKDKKKISNRVKADIEKKEGTSVKWEDGKLKLNVNKKF